MKEGKDKTSYRGVCSKCGESFMGTKYYTQQRRIILCSDCLPELSKLRFIKKHNQDLVPPEISYANSSFAANTWHTAGFSTGLKLAIMQRDGWKCYICGKSTNLHVHHLIPRSDGGEHTAENLVTLCGGCHRSIESGNVEKAIKNCVQRAMKI